MPVESLTNLRASLKTHQGEPVLVVTRVIRNIGSCHGPSIGVELDETLHLGICTCPFLSTFRNRQHDFAIPAPQHVISYDRFARERIEKKTGRIEDHKMSIWAFDETLMGKPSGIFGYSSGDFSSAEHLEHKDKLKLEVKVGEAEVTSWFIHHAFFGRMPIYDRMAVVRLEREQKYQDVQAIRERHFRADVLYGYQKMRQALGLMPAVLPVDIQTKVDSGIETERLGILKRLEESYRLRNISDLRRHLDRAIGYEMDTIEWIVRRNEFQGGTLEINVTEFIKAIKEMVEA